MFYLALLFIASILAIAIYIFWQALILFLTTKILKVQESTYKKALKISLWIFLVAIPIILLVKLIQVIPIAPKAFEVIGDVVGVAWIFIAANYFYKIYYQTGIGKNVAIFLFSNAINIIIGILAVLLIVGPLWFSMLNPFASKSEDNASQTQLLSSQPLSSSTDDNKQANNNDKATVHFIIKDEQENLMAGIQCDLKDNSKNTVISSITSNISGECSFTDLNPTNQTYSVEVNWSNPPRRRDTGINDFLRPGATITQIIVLPSQ
jgi:hypothetical protein